MSYAVYHIARFYEGENDPLPFVTTHPDLQPVHEVFEHNATLRTKYMGLYEMRARIAELRHKRDFLRTRGFHIHEDKLNQIDQEIGQAVWQEGKVHKDYEMCRRLWAFEVAHLVFE